MNASEEHEWLSDPKTVRFGTWYKCVRCGVKRCYSWCVGWPGWYDYFGREGHRLDREPTCTGWRTDTPLPDTIVLGEE